jgi:histidinol dehydrogenase
VRIEHIAVHGDPGAVAAAARDMAPKADSVTDGVAQIIASVREGGDAALRELVGRLDYGGAAPDDAALRMPPQAFEVDLDPELRNGLQVAIANVAIVADAGVGEDREVVLPQGQTVTLREVPVTRAAIYVPGGRNPYPSTLIMGVVTARAAGVEEVCVVTPPPVHPVILGAAALAGVHEIYAMGGAHAVAALAYGTESVPRVDVIAGPGNLWVQEAKRQVCDAVGIDGFYGPSDLAVVFDADADLAPIAFDLLAQGEHGPASVVLAASDDGDALEALADFLTELAAGRETVDAGGVVLAHAANPAEALAVSEAFAPEHLQLVGPSCERLARHVQRAGCVLVGGASGTAFGDYVAGSNHCLPTGGAARFASGLSARVFRRRMSEVRLGPAAAALAPAGAAIARAEGFEVHAQSMEARIGQHAGEGI